MNTTTQHRDVLLLLALCPLVAASDTVLNALGAGALVLIVATLTALVLTPVRRALTPEVQFPAAVLVFAGAAACMEVALYAYFPDLHEALGVFAPLIIANIVLIALLADDHASSVLGVVRLSLAIGAALLVLGAARELVGRGSLFHDAGLVLGAWAQPFEMKVFRVDMGFLLGMLPPGAFIALGLLLAARNWWMRR